MPEWDEVAAKDKELAAAEVEDRVPAAATVAEDRDRVAVKGKEQAAPEVVQDGGNEMKVCIPTMGSEGMNEAVSQHFGQAPTFTVVDMDTNEVEVLSNRSTHMGGSGLPPDMLNGHGINVMIVGGLGPKAVQAFCQYNIEVFVGATGTVKDAISDWKEGYLNRADLDNACREHRH
jgi:predicted Fe-Mo cluster-binding NifX family protein